jgi:hypothetical protein
MKNLNDIPDISYRLTFPVSVGAGSWDLRQVGVFQRYDAKDVCLLLALQWGGTTYPWSSGQVVAPLVVAGCCVSGVRDSPQRRGYDSALGHSQSDGRAVYALCILLFRGV